MELGTYYQGREKPKVHILVKKPAGFFTGFGFERTKTGLRLHIDDMDQKKLGKLKQSYAESKVMKSIEGRSKFSVSSRSEEEGKVKLRVKCNF